METNWAVDNLQTIRTLMERSALYRRALAPIMILAGIIGIAAGLTDWLCRIESNRGFVWLWLVTAIISLAGALLLMRRQALKDSEPFWSPPTRRVCQALLPAFIVGLVMACLILAFSSGSGGAGIQILLVILWVLFYGCAVHAAGFFMPRGIRWLGWIFIIVGCVLLSSLNLGVDHLQPNLLMGGLFGGLHLAYGIYLHFTEQKTPTA
jgi:drug/metabolite transporter (DMT)-like permease